MKRGIVLVLVLVAACGADRATSELEAAPAPDAPVRALRQTHRWARFGSPVAFTADGARWIAASFPELVVYDGAREVARYPVPTGGTDSALAPLPGGGWIAGTRVLAADGTVRFDGWSWAHRYGRFGSPKASAISPDGRIAIIYGADSPSTCLCDRDRGTAGSSAGALVRVELGAERTTERVLAKHPSRVEYAVAAAPTAVAAAAGDALSVWPATGDAAPVTAAIPGGALRTLAWATDRYLVGTRTVDVDRTDVVVLDRDAGWQPAWTWSVPGWIKVLAIRPGGAEVAIAWTNYRATDRVLRDDRKVSVYALDGTRHAELDTKGYPESIAWSLQGDALLVATVGQQEADAAVLRYAVR